MAICTGDGLLTLVTVRSGKPVAAAPLDRHAREHCAFAPRGPRRRCPGPNPCRSPGRRSGPPTRPFDPARPGGPSWWPVLAARGRGLWTSLHSSSGIWIALLAPVLLISGPGPAGIWGGRQSTRGHRPGGEMGRRPPVRNHPTRNEPRPGGSGLGARADAATRLGLGRRRTRPPPEPRPERLPDGRARTAVGDGTGGWSAGCWR